MIDVTVKVPEDRVPDFYSMFGRWLAGAEAPPPEPDTGSDSDAKEWSRSDAALARKVWVKFSPPAKALFSTLASNPSHKYSGDELAQALGLENGRHGLAGVLAWPRRHCFAVGRKWCWKWEYPDGETAVYWMNPEMAEVFRLAAENEN